MYTIVITLIGAVCGYVEVFFNEFVVSLFIFNVIVF